MRRPSPVVQEAAVAFLGALVLACVMFWPLPRALSTTVAKDAGDPLLQAWQLAWDGHALLHQPLHAFQANLFFPERDSLGFSDSLVGYGPLAWLGGGIHAALWHYNVLFLLVYAMSVTGPYLLARELGLRKGPAAVCGVAFAYSPWRWEQSGHLHVISSGTIALCVALLLRGYRRGHWRPVLGGFVVAAWQVLIGVSLGLFLLYLLLALGAVAGVHWWRAGRPRPSVAVAQASAGGLAVLAIALLLVGPTYLRVKHQHPESKRDLSVVRVFSPPLRSFLVTSADNPVWGARTAGNRAKLTSVPEQTLFPGLTTLALAALGLATRAFSRRLRIGLVIAALLSFLFSLGLTFDDGRLTYRLLYDHAPGWDGIRTPGRLHLFTTLVLALLAGAGMQWLLERARPLGARAAVLGVRLLVFLGPVPTDAERLDPLRLQAGGARLLAVRGPVLVAGALSLLLAVPVLAEGSAFRRHVPGAGVLAGPNHPVVPLPPPGLAAARAPYLELPPDDPLVYDYMLWSVDGFPEIVNGRSGFDPTLTTQLKAATTTFPDAASVAALRAQDVQTVVLYPSTAAGTPWAGVANKPIDGLGITRRSLGGVILFDLNP